MKRWIRRILLGCLVLLVAGTPLLYLRGLYRFDLLVVYWGAIVNGRDYVAAAIINEPEVSFESHPHDLEFEPMALIPWPIVEPDAIGLLIPHWMLFVIGLAYFVIAWRRRRRNQEGGFPVVGAKEPVVSKVEP